VVTSASVEHGSLTGPEGDMRDQRFFCSQLALGSGRACSIAVHRNREVTAPRVSSAAACRMSALKASPMTSAQTDDYGVEKCLVSRICG